MDGQAIPLGVTATGANVHDSRLIGAPLKNSREMDGWFLEAEVRHLCLDKGDDYPRVSEEVYVNGFEGHIRSRGKEVRERRSNPAHRWVVERTFAWLKGFRSLRTRHCCYLANFMRLLYLALACFLWRKSAWQGVCRTCSFYLYSGSSFPLSGFLQYYLGPKRGGPSRTASSSAPMSSDTAGGLSGGLPSFADREGSSCGKGSGGAAESAGRGAGFWRDSGGG